MIENIKNISVLDNTDSVSPSKIFFADFNNQNVAIKVFLSLSLKDLKKDHPRLKDYNNYTTSIDGLMYENDIYEKLISKYLNYSPHFIEYLKTIKTSYLEFNKYFRTNINKFVIFNTNFFDYPNLHNNTQTTLIITKRYNNFTNLDKLILSNSIKIEDIICVMFQIIYTLYVMEVLELQHNDLHLFNVLVILNDIPITYYYKVDDIYFKITSIYEVKFFDWDLSFDPKLGINKKIDEPFYKNVGIYNKFTPKFDLFTLFCSIYNVYKTNNSLLNACFIVNSIFKSNFKDKPIDDFWYKNYKDSGHDCRARKEIPDSILDRPITILLNNPIFNIFKIDKTDINEYEKIYRIP